MKKIVTLIMMVLISVALGLAGCSGTGAQSTSGQEAAKKEATAEKEPAAETPTPTKTETKTETKKSYSASEEEKKSSTSVTFTNAYGTPTTECAHAGCHNYIASSGDTCYCTLHSNNCLECGKYIDEDAMYCLSCIEKTAESISSGNSKPSNGSGYSTYDDDDDSAGYGYDPSDPYYAANDHDGDGKLSDKEFQDAMNDAIDDLLEQYNY